MEYNLFCATGWIHLIASVIALITGTIVLAMKKGTEKHKKVGYLYAGSMVVVVATAFMIYRLFSGWYFPLGGSGKWFNLAGGIIPVLLRKPKNNWLGLHFGFMYWSVMGLYAAFVSEVVTRVPESPFFGMVGIGTSIIMVSGGIYFYFGKHKWEELI